MTRPTYCKFKWRGFIVEAEGYPHNSELTELNFTWENGGSEATTLDVLLNLKPVQNDWNKMYDPMIELTELFQQTCEEMKYDNHKEA
jgi:hypothetical protein